MNTILIIALLLFAILFCMSELVFLNENDLENGRFHKLTYLVTLATVVACSVAVASVIPGFSIVEKAACCLVAVACNPMLVLFPFSNLTCRMGCKTRDILSKILLVFFSVASSLGFTAMMSSASASGNSTLFLGVILVLWAMPNILLATIMPPGYLFTGVVKILTGAVSLVFMCMRHTVSEYDGTMESTSKIIAFLMCGYLLLDGYMFIEKHTQTRK